MKRRDDCPHSNADHVGPGKHLTCFAKVEHLKCLDCGDWCSLGPSNDRIPRREDLLAECLAEINLLWEPGLTRTTLIAQVVDQCAAATDSDLKIMLSALREARTIGVSPLEAL